MGGHGRGRLMNKLADLMVSYVLNSNLQLRNKGETWPSPYYVIISSHCLYTLNKCTCYALLQEREHERLAVLEALDNGKTISQARMVDANACAFIMRYYAGWTNKIHGM
jgi:hypothetical protein